MSIATQDYVCDMRPVYEQSEKEKQELIHLSVRAPHNCVFDYEPSSKEIRSEFGISKWATNCNWIKTGYSVDNESRNQGFYAVKGLKSIDTRDGEDFPLTLDLLIDQYGIFNIDDYWSSARVQVAVDKNSPRRWTFRKEAKSEEFRSIQINPKGYYRFLVVDIDMNDSLDIALNSKFMPPPSFFVHDAMKGTGHSVYCIKNPVPHLTGDSKRDWVKTKPQRYYNYVRSLVNKALMGDHAYTGHFMKSPFCPDFTTYWGHSSNVYTLSELEECAVKQAEFNASMDDNIIRLFENESDLVRSEERKAKQRARSIALQDQSVGRNKSIFDLVRKWAYKNRKNFDNLPEWLQAVFDVCKEVNKDLAQSVFRLKGMLGEREVLSIARSIAAWTWKNKNLSENGFFSDKQRKRSIKVRQERAFNKVVRLVKDTLKEASKLYGTAKTKTVIDRKSKTICLPKNMTKKDFIFFYKSVHNSYMPSHINGYLIENISDVSVLSSEREKFKRTLGLRNLGELSLEEQIDILCEIMSSIDSYSVVEKKFFLMPEVCKRLVHKYKNQPWTLQDYVIATDKEKEILRESAKERWNRSVRNGGSYTTPFDDFKTENECGEVKLCSEEESFLQNSAFDFITYQVVDNMPLLVNYTACFAHGMTIEGLSMGIFYQNEAEVGSHVSNYDSMEELSA